MNHLSVGRLVLVLSISLLSPGFIFAQNSSAIKIGAITSLQGGAAEQGQSWLDGATLAVEELNGEGISCKLIVEDDGTQSAKAASAFNKLAKVDRVNAIIGGTWDYLGEAIYPLAARNKLFTLTPSNQKENLSDSAKNNPFVLTNGLSLAAEEKVIEPFLKNSKKKTLGIVSVQVPFATVHAGLVKNIASRLNLEQVGEIEISLSDQPSAFKLAAQRLARKSPDIIYIVADYNQLDLFVTELENIKSAPIVLTTQHLEGAFKLSNQNHSRYKNCYGVHPKYKNIDFDQHFKARFGHSPGVFAAEGYDAAQFLIRSFNASPEGPRARGFSYQGLKGAYQYQPGQNAVVNDTAIIVTFKDGKLIETLAPL